MRAMPAGRPSTYSQEIADEICERLAGGESVLAMVEADAGRIPPQTVIFQWLLKHEDFAQNYARARRSWAEFEFERMMQIADTPQLGVKIKTTDKGTETIEGDMVDHRRLQVDTRKWALARMFPKKYGDAQLIKHGDPDGNKLQVEITRVVPKRKD